ncbi:MAG: GlxA family transcriptional regulator [Pseudomonadales bacterium]
MIHKVRDHSQVADDKTYRIGFLLIENFTLMALATAMEPLRMANQLTGKELYSWQLIAQKPESIRASDGMQMVPDVGIQDASEFDLVFVVSGVEVATSCSEPEIRWLQTMARKKMPLGAVCTGSYVLAKANLLKDYSSSAHWEYLASLQEQFPDVCWNNQLFTFDRDRITCSGGDVPLHMMMSLVSLHHGQELANAISDMFVCERIRQGDEPQRMRMDSQVYANQPKLAEAVHLMEANVEEPIDLSDIARYAGVSRRHLERQFLSNLGCTPSRFYLKLRLERAQQLLKQTSCSIVDIASMTGFVSTTHFSRCYRKYMGKAPKAERRSKATTDSPLAPAPANSDDQAVALNLDEVEIRDSLL